MDGIAEKMQARRQKAKRDLLADYHRVAMPCRSNPLPVAVFRLSAFLTEGLGTPGWVFEKFERNVAPTSKRRGS